MILFCFFVVVVVLGFVVVVVILFVCLLHVHLRNFVQLNKNPVTYTMDLIKCAATPTRGHAEEVSLAHIIHKVSR